MPNNAKQVVGFMVSTSHQLPKSRLTQMFLFKPKVETQVQISAQKVSFWFHEIVNTNDRKQAWYRFFHLEASQIINLSLNAKVKKKKALNGSFTITSMIC